MLDAPADEAAAQPAAGSHPHLRTRFLRVYVAAAAVILLGAWGLARFMAQQLRADYIDQARRLATTTAVTLPALPPLDPALMVTVVDADGTLLHLQHVTHPDNLAWRQWHDRLGRAAAGVTGEVADHPVGSDPQGGDWVHVAAVSPDGQFTVVLSQPGTAFFRAPLFVQRLLLLSTVLLVVVGGVAWWAITNSLIRPIERLVDFSEVIRWRGFLRPAEAAEIADLARHAAPTGLLADSLLALEQETHKRFDRLAGLLETSHVVAASLEADEVIDNILGQVQALFHVERCAVLALDARAGVFRIRASRGMSAEYVEQLRITPSEPNSPAMRALRNREPIQVPDIENDLAGDYYRERARREGFRSVLAIPLATTYAPPAVLMLQKGEPYRYSFSELELASSFADHASIALENAALFAQSDERLQEQTRRLEAIVESLDDALILEGLDGRILYGNQRAATLFGVRWEQLRGQDSAELIRPVLLAARDSVELLQQMAPGAGRSDFTVDLMHPVGDDATQDWRIHVFEVADARGHPLGRGQLWQDITHDKELDRMKSALLSTVSHELRTPLATIKGYATTLLARDVAWDEAAQREFLTIISHETDRLATLVKNLLDMSRIEAGLLAVRREPFSLNDVVTGVLRDAPPALRARVRLTLADDLPPAPMDVSRISTVVRNYLDNAGKYSPAGAPIDLTTGYADGAVTLTVRDFGDGVPPELQTQIFQRFFRADNRLTRRTGGVGLGLAICKGFVAAHDGQVWVSAEQPGTVFGFALPVAVPAAAH